MASSFLSAVAIAAASSGMADDAILHDFKGVPLEITQDEFRARAHPDGIANARTVCTGDQVNRKYLGVVELLELRVYDPILLMLGVKECKWVFLRNDDAQYISAGETAPLRLADSGYAAYDYSFRFIPDEQGALRLYEIEVTGAPQPAFDNVLAALQNKYGDGIIVEKEVQNEMGASFPQTVATWSSDRSSIVVMERFSQIDKMAIFVSSNRLSKIISDQKETEKREQENPI